MSLWGNAIASPNPHGFRVARAISLGFGSHVRNFAPAQRVGSVWSI